MKKSLLITTALVTVFSATNAFSEALPSDATNLTTGNYVIEDTGSQNIHNGNIKISENASLDVNTYVEVDEEQNKVTDTTHAFVVDGNLEVGDATNGGGSLTIKRDDAEKPFMIVTGDLTVNEGSSLEMHSSSDFSSTINVGKDAFINGGDINLNNAEI